MFFYNLGKLRTEAHGHIGMLFGRLACNNRGGGRQFELGEGMRGLTGGQRS